MAENMSNQATLDDLLAQATDSRSTFEAAGGHDDVDLPPGTYSVILSLGDNPFRVYTKDGKTHGILNAKMMLVDPDPAKSSDPLLKALNGKNFDWAFFGSSYDDQRALRKMATELNPSFKSSEYGDAVRAIITGLRANKQGSMLTFTVGVSKKGYETFVVKSLSVLSQ